MGTTDSARSRLARAWETPREGGPLPAELRDDLERVLGAKLAAVRIHTGSAADAVARAYGADAIASGSGIFFRNGAYRPDTAAGRHLLAHEVAHTVQQAGGAPGGSEDAEADADRFADAFLAGAPRDAAGHVTVPAGPSRTGAVQLHASFEHRWLGDGKPVDLREVSTKGPGWQTILQRQIQLMALWRTDPFSVDEAKVHSVDKDLVTVRLGPDKVLATYGDVNALPDYLANPEQVDSMGADILMPILQVIRQEGFNAFTKLLTGRDPAERFALAPFGPTGWGLVDAIVETTALDQLTAGLGPAGQDHYRGLLARNACHFAPYSWHRWSTANTVARQFAESYFKTKNPEDLRQARNYGGYADHFLEDSFAAGHLIDKTLVMQWFVEWAGDSDLLPDHDVLRYMTAALQPGLQAGARLYDPAYAGPSHDPQTVQELRSLAIRATGGGNGPGRERDQLTGYLDYLTFLTSAASQLAAAELHDHYNGNSLWVASAAQPTAYRIWGDDTLLSGAGGGPGVFTTAETAQMSRTALDEIMKFGGTSIDQAKIRSRFPTRAGSSQNQITDLRTWATGQKAWVEENVFTPFADKLKDLLLQLSSPRLGVVSRDEPIGEQWYTGLGDKLAFDQVALLPDGDSLFLASDGYLYEADARTGAIRKNKTMTLPDTTLGSKTNSLAMDDNQVYVGINGHVHAAPRNGAWGGGPTWSTDALGVRDSLLPVAVLLAGNRLFAACHGYLSEIDKSNGKVLQRIAFGKWWQAGLFPVDLATDGELIYAGTHGAAYAVRLHGKWDDKWVWSTKQHLGNPGVDQTVRILLKGDRLFAATNGWAYEIRRSNGDVLQSLRFHDAGAADQPAHLAGDGGRLYIGSHGVGYALPLDVPWGKDPLWRTERLSVLREHAPAAMLYIQDRLFAGCDGYVYEVNLLDGTLQQQWLLTSLLSTGLNFDTELATDGGGRFYAGLHGYAYGMLLASTLVTPAAAWPLSGLVAGKVPDRRGLFPATAQNVTFSATEGIGGFANFVGDGAISTSGPVLDTAARKPFTVSAWVRLNRLPDAQKYAAVLSQSGTQVSTFSLGYSATLGGWVFERAAADAPNPVVNRVVAKVPQTPGVWTHVAGVYDPDARTAGGKQFTEMRIYVDGTMLGALEVEPNHAFAAAGPFQIGVARALGRADGHLNGAVRDVRVYRQALDELRLEPDAAAFWRLDETSGTVAHDAERRHNATATVIRWQPVPGVGGVAGFENSVSGIATSGPVLNTGPSGSFTVAGWISLDRLPGGNTFLAAQDTGQSSVFSLQYAVSTKSWHFTRYLTNGTETSVDSGIPVKAGEWHHVAGVYDAVAGLMHVYLDGRLRGSATFRNSSAISSSGAFTIGFGRRGGAVTGRLLGGRVRDVRTYVQPLTAEQVRALLAR
ncbi:MAG: DUF4157 domain-containing protein [Catenulispora sp.]|nr:DUF4157 domain-containing protein [Catenulispora sp.]